MSMHVPRHVIYSCLLIPCVLSLAACSTSNPAKDTVDSYLKALQRNPMSMEAEYRCFPFDPADSTQMIKIRSWEILSQERQIDDKYADIQTDVVSVRITEQAMGGFDVTNVWKATVWESEDLFEVQKRVLNDVDKVMADGHERMNQVNEFLGEPPEPPDPVSTPDRSRITSQPYCSTGIVRSE